MDGRFCHRIFCRSVTLAGGVTLVTEGLALELVMIKCVDVVISLVVVAVGTVLLSVTDATVVIEAVVLVVVAPEAVVVIEALFSSRR
jgi:hypothetical protein